jgi:hypothetical protein
MPAYATPSKMSMPLQETAAHGRSEFACLSSAQAASLRAEFGPNAVVDEPIHPLGRFARHFWAPVPWMLDQSMLTGESIPTEMEAGKTAFAAGCVRTPRVR